MIGGISSLFVYIYLLSVYNFILYVNVLDMIEANYYE